MTTTTKRYIGIGMILMALAVLIGAFGAHALKPRITPHYLDVFETGSRYHFIHGLGMILTLFVLDRIDVSRDKQKMVFRLFIGGILLFSGSLYILSIAELIGLPQLKIMGAITPLGGLLFIAAWIYSATLLFKTKN